MTETSRSRTVLCFGEILWDSLPQALFPGGAPINVAYHLQRLGVHALPLTAVGGDLLGEELKRRLRRWGLDTTYVATLSHKSTGFVRVELEHGLPTYEFLEDVAWDWIEVSPGALDQAEDCAAFVFGTLAQRSENNRYRLSELIERARKGWRIYDVNLRHPYDDPQRVASLCEKANLIKLNEGELNILLGPTAGSDLPARVRAFAEKSGCPRICVTAGAQGAGLLFDTQWTWIEGRPIQVRDTVGAGDAFLAGLIHGLLAPGASPRNALEQASHLAEFVATRDGATPAYTVSPNGEILD